MIMVKVIKISNKSSFTKGIYYKNNNIYDNFFTNKKYSLKENNFLKLNRQSIKLYYSIFCTAYFRVRCK